MVNWCVRSKNSAQVDRISFVTRSDTEDLILINEIDSPYGSGWGIAGLTRLIENADGSVLMVDGDGEEELFGKPVSPGAAYISPPGEFSTLLKQPNGRFQLRSPEQAIISFNSDNQQSSVRDRNGNETTFLYNDFGGLVSMTDPVGLKTQLTYIDGKLASITDPAGRIATIEIDGEGNLSQVTDNDGSVRKWLYDDLHHMVGEQDQLGRTETAVFNEAGRVTEAIRKDGSSIAVSPVDLKGLVFGIDTTDPRNPTIISDLATPDSIYVDANGTATSFRLDPSGQTQTSRNIEGTNGSVIRDGRNLVIARSDGAWQPNGFHVQRSRQVALQFGFIVQQLACFIRNH